MKFIFDIQRFDSYWHKNTDYIYYNGFPKSMPTNNMPTTGWTKLNTTKEAYNIYSSSATKDSNLKKTCSCYLASQTGSTTTLYNCTLTYLAETSFYTTEDDTIIYLDEVYVSGFYNSSTNYSKYVRLGAFNMLAEAYFKTYGWSSANPNHYPETIVTVSQLKNQPNIYYDNMTLDNVKNELLLYLKNKVKSTDDIVKLLGKNHFPYYHTNITGNYTKNNKKTYYRTTFSYSGTNGNVVNYVANIIKKFIIKI